MVKKQTKDYDLLIYTPASGASMAENTDYFVVLPAVKITKGITLAFILDNGKAVQVKFSNTIDIKRAQSYSLGDIAINPAKAKLDVITDKGLIEAVRRLNPYVELEADGSLNIYQGYNLDRILKLKGELDLSNNDKLTSLNGLQYFQNITSIKLFGNQNLAGNIDFTKCKQLTGQILVDNCQAVKSINVTGLDIKQLTARSLKGLEQVTIKGNNKLSSVVLNSNENLKSVDVSNLPALETQATFYSGKITTINTSISQNLKEINASSNNGFLANIEVTMTAAQKTTVNLVKPFKESENDNNANVEDTNSCVKAIVR